MSIRYKIAFLFTAFDKLSELAQKEEQMYVVSVYPIIYNYRHATELLIKSVLQNHEETHNLLKLYEKFEEYLLDRFNYTPTKWIENIIGAFNDFDPYGITFRYGVKINNESMVVDFNHIKKIMDLFCQLITAIKEQQ